MDSTSIIGVLPDKVVIWVQFGTRYFIDYIKSVFIDNKKDTKILVGI